MISHLHKSFFIFLHLPVILFIFPTMVTKDKQVLYPTSISCCFPCLTYLLPNNLPNNCSYFFRIQLTSKKCSLTFTSNHLHTILSSWHPEWFSFVKKKKKVCFFYEAIFSLRAEITISLYLDPSKAPGTSFKYGQQIRK